MTDEQKVALFFQALSQDPDLTQGVAMVQGVTAGLPAGRLWQKVRIIAAVYNQIEGTDSAAPTT